MAQEIVIFYCERKGKTMGKVKLGMVLLALVGTPVVLFWGNIKEKIAQGVQQVSNEDTPPKGNDPSKDKKPEPVDQKTTPPVPKDGKPPERTGSKVQLLFEDVEGYQRAGKPDFYVYKEYMPFKCQLPTEYLPEEFRDQLKAAVTKELAHTSEKFDGVDAVSFWLGEDQHSLVAADVRLMNHRRNTILTTKPDEEAWFLVRFDITTKLPKQSEVNADKILKNLHREIGRPVGSQLLFHELKTLLSDVEIRKKPGGK